MGLKLKDLNVSILDKKILNDFSLEINDGEVHVLMGPNGMGKSTLSKIIMGSRDYTITSGDILFQDESILNFDTCKRSQLGIFLAYQNPLSIEGVTNSEFLRTALASHKGHVGLYEFIKQSEEAIDELGMDKGMLHRAVNQGFSGGERKKNEILQLKLLQPSFIILDEIDSGLDIDSLKTVCLNINKYLEAYPNTSVLIITHYPRILEYIKPDYVHMMMNGQIVKTGDLEFAFAIEKNGYHWSNVVDGIDKDE